MNRTIATLALGLMASMFLACAGATGGQDPTTNKPRNHVMVQFTDMSVHPSVAQVTSGGTISWVNYASMSEGTIVFSDEVAAAFNCSLRPQWAKTGTGYQSIPITMGGASNDLATPCGLKPGEYEYQIWLYNQMGGPGEIDNPDQRVTAKIVVR